METWKTEKEVFAPNLTLFIKHFTAIYDILCAQD